MSEDEAKELESFVMQEKHWKTTEDTWLTVWSGGSDEKEEGKFINVHTGQPLSYVKWAPNTPIVNNAMNCLQSFFGKHNDTHSNWGSSDRPCFNEPKFAVCMVNSRNLKFRLRGLCAKFSFDREYVYSINEHGQEMFIGRKNSVLLFNTTTDLWHLYNPRENLTLITSSSSRESQLWGFHQLSFVKAKKEQCYKESEPIQNVKLTTCTNGQFTCADGACISIEERCDQTSNCKDKSDERGCKLIVFEGYNKNIAPFKVNPETKEISAVVVNISATIVNVLKIDEVQQAFQAKFKLLLTWYDRRLIYYNLKENRIANSPTYEDAARLWIPSIVFDNTEYNDVMSLDANTKVTVTKEGISTLSDETEIDEAEIFKGSENKISFDKGFTKTVECIYQLQLYPFDTQKCTVNLMMGQYEKDLIKLFPKDLEMEGRKLLTQYVITDWKLEYKNKGKYNC